MSRLRNMMPSCRSVLLFVGLLVLLGASTPLIHFSGASFDVEVTWSIHEKTPQNRHLTVDDQTFMIPAGEKVVRQCRLRGGGKRALLWGTEGFGLGRSRLQIEGFDGFLMPRVLSHSGDFHILGMGLKKTLEVEIELID